jgi:hypothetical protein
MAKSPRQPGKGVGILHPGGEDPWLLPRTMDLSVRIRVAADPGTLRKL